MTEHDIFALAINEYGEKAQEDIAIEECGELICAISHKHRGREHNIPEEIADVEIMLEQLKIINDCHADVERIKARKIVRLFKKILNRNGRAFVIMRGVRG